MKNSETLFGEIARHAQQMAGGKMTHSTPILLDDRRAHSPTFPPSKYARQPKVATSTTSGERDRAV